MIVMGIIVGFVLWFFFNYIYTSFYKVEQNERAVLTSFGKAIRLSEARADFGFNEREKLLYDFPQLKVVGPGGPYFKWPWEKVHKINVATETIDMAMDLENSDANNQGTILEAVTKDQLNTGLTGQIRYRVSEQNLYAFVFGIKNPLIHVMGYFISILRERIANFEAPPRSPSDQHLEAGSELKTANVVSGVSINDLRKNLRDINDHMEKECSSSEGRYGIILDASLITGIDPPAEVESALAAINTAHNNVSSDISLAQAGADQKIVQSRKAVEIETLKAEAEVQPLTALAQQLYALKRSGGANAVESYVRNVKLGVYKLITHAVIKGDA
jgi:regulator of protease activity HflC (stomatin/prohibitin superfamily)